MNSQDKWEVPIGKSVPKPPPAPDPYQTAAAQTGSNVTTAQANAIMNNANEKSVLGNVNYNITGYQTVKDPTTGKSYSIPKYERVQTLSPSQQKLYDQQVQLGQGLNNLAIQQTGKLTDLMGKPIDTVGLPDAPGNSEAYRQQVEQAMMTRMNPQLDRDRSALETRLVNQGLVRGSEAFNQALDETNRQANDARTQVFLASGAEGRAQEQQQATNRERAFQERISLRNQPINEITALMSGGQVSMPQFTPYRAANMSETPVGQYIYDSAQMEQNAWAQQQQMRAANNAAIFGAAGNVLGAGLYKWSDARLKRDVSFSHMENGRRFYRYRYLWSDDFEVGVMAQENPDIAVMMPNGFHAVDYGAL
jgi:hypothetical protein